MSTVPLSVDGRRSGSAGRVLAAGALVGVLDMLYAVFLFVVVFHRSPAILVPQSVASGLLGKAAYQGGLATATLGLVLHFIIAYAWTVAFYIAARSWPPLQRLLATTRGAVVAGVVFGVIVCLAMNLIVLPLSLATPPRIMSLSFLLQLVWHPIGVGLPIALIAGRSPTR
jgi:hypothetical protein